MNPILKDVLLVLMPLALLIIPIIFNQNETKKDIKQINEKLDSSFKYRKTMGRYNLYASLKQYIADGYISERDFLELSEIYNFCHDELKINNEITLLFEEVKKLERIK